MKKLLVLSLLLFLAVSLTGCKSKVTLLGPEEAKAKAESFINENLVPAGSEVSVGEVEEMDNVYKLKVALSDGNELDSYITKDGKFFFPQGMSIEEAKEESGGSASNQNQEVPKSDKPVVELFVMSHCPYGTQIEKGILPVLDTLGDKIDFSLKFCDYAMHGEKELNEQLAQHCIQKEQGDKLQSYLYCFLEEGDGSGCLSEAGLNISQLNDCISSTDSEFRVSEKNENKEDWKGNYPPFDVDAADNEKYGVQGSPSLIINGVKSSSGRDAQSLLNAICGAFNNMPEECSEQLDSTPPAPGFGFEGTGSNSSAGCGG